MPSNYRNNFNNKMKLDQVKNFISNDQINNLILKRRVTESTQWKYLQ